MPAPIEGTSRGVKRTRHGHWEGDTVEGAGKSAYTVTLADRRSRFALVGRSKSKSEEAVDEVVKRLLQRLRRSPRRTLTLDNGTEFNDSERLEAITGCKVYFADPYSSWQRGTNEQTNGVMRREGSKLRRMQSRHLLRSTIARPCQFVRTGRRSVLRVHSYSPWTKVPRDGTSHFQAQRRLA